MTSQIAPRGVEPHEVGERQRTHRVARAGLHRPVDVVDRPDALLVRADGIEHVRNEQPVHDEPGAVACGDADLPELRGELLSRLEGLVGRRDERMTSTSCITCGGLKKWSARKRSGRPIRAACRTTGRDDVFVAKIASSLTTGQPRPTSRACD
jgi:hypothetical protein